MSLDVLFKILGSLEIFLAKVALVGFKRHVDSDMRSNVVAFDGDDSAVVPSAG